jgi:shikimate kinase
MRIFLIGLIGSGKTTLGKKLAESLKIPFIDLDEYIVRKELKSISEIFSLKGETYFRECEAKYLREICQFKDAVVATGGGAACFHDNMTVMNVSGVTIFLDVPLDTLTERLWHQPQREQRPMIAGKTKEELRTFVKEIHQSRIEFYKEAKLIFKGNDISADQILYLLDELD